MTEPAQVLLGVPKLATGNEFYQVPGREIGRLCRAFCTNLSRDKWWSTRQELEDDQGERQNAGNHAGVLSCAP